MDEEGQTWISSEGTKTDSSQGTKNLNQRPEAASPPNPDPKTAGFGCQLGGKNGHGRGGIGFLARGQKIE